MKKRFLAILLGLCMVVTLLPTVALAVGETTAAIQLGTSAISGYDRTTGYDYIYFGSYDSTPIKWRVLSDTSSGESYKDAGGDDYTGRSLFLLSEGLLGTGTYGDVYFKQDSSSNAWQNSDAQAWCKDFAGERGSSVTDAFSGDELAAILATTKNDNGFTSTTASVPFASVNGILSGDKVFFLSAEESENSDYGFDDDDARIANYDASARGWWLRSPCAHGDDSAGLVTGGGNVLDCNVNAAWAARPAFHLNLNSVLFTSAADNSGHNDSFMVPTAYIGNEWKLTLADNNDFSADASISGSVNLSEGYSDETLIINHAALSSLSAEYTNVTAMLTDETSKILYYGSINPDPSATESFFAIPIGLNIGEYSLYVYGEDWNEENYTDYATGKPFSTKIVVSAPHTHSYSLTYQYSDGTGHWQECSDASCPDADKGKTATEAHSYSDESDTLCDTCGYTRTITPIHSHSLAYKYSDGTGHWQECSDASCPDADKGKTATEAHSYSGDSDTSCDTCGYIRTNGMGGNGDNDDSDDDDPTITPSTSVTVPVSINENSTQVNARISGTTAIIDDTKLSSFDTVLGDHVDDVDSITLNFSVLNKKINAVELSADLIEKIHNLMSGLNARPEILKVIFTDNSSIGFDAESLRRMYEWANALNITISIKRIEDSLVNSLQQQTIGNRPALDINITSGSMPISDIGGNMTMSTPYELNSGENAEGIKVFYVDDNGNKEPCDTNYDSVKKKVKWETDHLSVYMIGYEEPQISPKTGDDTPAEEIHQNPDAEDKPSTAPAYMTYTVKHGDTLWAISLKYGCTISEIVTANSDLIKNPNLIYAGCQLKIPQSASRNTDNNPDAILPGDKKTAVYIVKRGDTLWAISQKYGCTIAEIVALNGELITDSDLIFDGWELKIP